MPSANSKKYKLVYFDIRGLAEPIRWMLAIADQEFEDERIPLLAWSQEKIRFSSQVGQLPILYVDDIVLTQVHACIRYVARRLGFNGQNEREEAKADEASELIYDLRLCCVEFKDSFYTENPDIIRHTVFRDFHKEGSIVKKARMRQQLVEIIFPKYFQKFADLLEEAGGQWIAGQNLTYADLCLANFLDVAETMVNPDVLKEYPTLNTLKKDVLAIPQIKKFIAFSKKNTFDG